MPLRPHPRGLREDRRHWLGEVLPRRRRLHHPDPAGAPVPRSRADDDGHQSDRGALEAEHPRQLPVDVHGRHLDRIRRNGERGRAPARHADGPGLRARARHHLRSDARRAGDDADRGDQRRPRQADREHLERRRSRAEEGRPATDQREHPGHHGRVRLHRRARQGSGRAGDQRGEGQGRRAGARRRGRCRGGGARPAHRGGPGPGDGSGGRERIRGARGPVRLQPEKGRGRGRARRLRRGEGQGGTGPAGSLRGRAGVRGRARHPRTGHPACRCRRPGRDQERGDRDARRSGGRAQPPPEAG